MKKIIIALNLVLLSLLISGCGCSKKEEEKTIVCKMNKTFDEYDYNANITIVYNEENNQLISIDEKEYFDFNDIEFLNTVKTFDEAQYSMYSNLKNTKYKITVDGNKMVRNFFVDYSKINIEELIEIDGSQLVFVNNENKTNINNALDYYRENGNTCE